MFTISPTITDQVNTWLRRIDNAEQRLERLVLKREQNGTLTPWQQEKEFRTQQKIDRLTGRLPKDSFTVVVDDETQQYSYQVVDSPFDDTISGDRYWLRAWGSSRCSQLTEADGNRNCSRRSGGGTIDRIDLEDGTTYTATGLGMFGSLAQRMSWEDNGFYLETWSGENLGEGERNAYFFTSNDVSGFYDHPVALAG